MPHFTACPPLLEPVFPLLRNTAVAANLCRYCYTIYRDCHFSSVPKTGFKVFMITKRKVNSRFISQKPSHFHLETLPLNGFPFLTKFFVCFNRSARKRRISYSQEELFGVTADLGDMSECNAALVLMSLSHSPNSSIQGKSSSSSRFEARFCHLDGLAAFEEML